MITIKTPAEVEKMRQGGRRLASVISELQRRVEVGVSTFELDQLARELIKKQGGQPSFLGYQGYPAALCTSINEQIVHGIPNKAVALKAGDLLSLDLGFCYQGLHTDMAVTLAVGRVSSEAKRLIKVTSQSLKLAIKTMKVGIHLGDVSFTIQSFIENNNFNVVRDLVGHGVGREIHEEPKIPNYGQSGTGPILQAGMTLALEPMVTLGNYQIRTLEDGWTIQTADNSLSAHFEHTILVTEKGAEVLTLNE